MVQTSVSTGGWAIEVMLGYVMFGFGIVCNVQVEEVQETHGANFGKYWWMGD